MNENMSQIASALANQIADHELWLEGQIRDAFPTCDEDGTFDLLVAEATRQAGDVLLANAIRKARNPGTYDQGLTWRQIATTLGRDHSSVKRWHDARS